MTDCAISLSELETKVLNALQNQIPLTGQPYKQIADELEAAEEDILSCVDNLYKKGIIRRLGASVNSREIGYVSTLAAARVSAASLESATRLINGFPEVTHNYLREGEYNVWFTVIARNQERADQILNEIRTSAGVESLLSLPAKKTFKINVKFPLNARC